MYYDRHITHNSLGFSNGFMGYGNGMEEYVQRKWPESDLEMIEGTLDLYLEHEPFDVYYMTVSGHNPYSNWLSEKHISRIQETGHTKEVRNYLAANMELEDAMAYLIRKLEEAGIADRTVIVLTADHFPYGLDYNAAFDQTVNLADLYGYQPASYLERDHNALLIWSGCLEQMEHIEVTDPVSSLDILPTLCNLFDVSWDSRLLPGRDVFSHKDPLVFTVNYEWKTDLGMYVNDTFYPLSEDIPEGYADTVIAIVRNKIKYCSDVLQYSYFTHVMHDQSVTD
jgi:lipoteichoic acid synthase